MGVSLLWCIELKMGHKFYISAYFSQQIIDLYENQINCTNFLFYLTLIDDILSSAEFVYLNVSAIMSEL